METMRTFCWLMLVRIALKTHAAGALVYMGKKVHEVNFLFFGWILLYNKVKLYANTNQNLNFLIGISIRRYLYPYLYPTKNMINNNISIDSLYPIRFYPYATQSFMCKQIFLVPITKPPPGHRLWHTRAARFTPAGNG